MSSKLEATVGTPVKGPSRRKGIDGRQGGKMETAACLGVLSVSLWLPVGNISAGVEFSTVTRPQSPVPSFVAAERIYRHQK